MARAWELTVQINLEPPMLYFFLALAVVAIIVLVRVAKIYKALHPAEPETGFTLSDDEMATTRAFLRKHPAIDTHAHPGRTFVRGAKNLQGPFKIFKLLGTFEAIAIKGMVEGQLTCSVFNGVSDFPLLTPAGSTCKPLAIIMRGRRGIFTPPR